MQSELQQLGPIATGGSASKVTIRRSTLSRPVAVYGQLTVDSSIFLADGPSIQGVVFLSNSIVIAGPGQFGVAISAIDPPIPGPSKIVNNTFIGGRIICAMATFQSSHFSSNIFYNHLDIPSSS